MRAVAEILAPRPSTAASQAEPGDVRARCARWSASTSASATPTPAGRPPPTAAHPRPDPRRGPAEPPATGWWRCSEPSLPTAPQARERAVHELHVATDVYSWKLLRRDLGLDRSRDRTDDGPSGRRQWLDPIPRTSVVPNRGDPDDPPHLPLRPRRRRRHRAARARRRAPTRRAGPRRHRARRGHHGGRGQADRRHVPPWVEAHQPPDPSAPRTTPTATGSARTRSRCSSASSTRSSSVRPRATRPTPTRRSPRCSPTLVVCSFFALGAMVAAEAAGVPVRVLHAQHLPAPGPRACTPVGTGPASGHGAGSGRCATGPSARSPAACGRRASPVSTRCAPSCGLAAARPTSGTRPSGAALELVLTSDDFDFPARCPPTSATSVRCSTTRVGGPSRWSPPPGDDAARARRPVVHVPGPGRPASSASSTRLGIAAGAGGRHHRPGRRPRQLTAPPESRRALRAALARCWPTPRRS